MKEDRNGNYIGDGTYHESVEIYEFPEYPQISHSVSYSNTSESAYVRYCNNENMKSVTVRFSNHISNSEEFGDQLNRWATSDEILYRLELRKREFIPNTRLEISWTSIKMKEVVNYEMADKTLKDLYDLGAGADISKYTGKLAKDSNRLILGDTVECVEESGINRLGQKVYKGQFIYSKI